jgi:hypothetical protein
MFGMKSIWARSAAYARAHRTDHVVVADGDGLHPKLAIGVAQRAETGRR